MQTRPTPEQLSSLPLFDVLSPADLARVAGWLELRRFEAGQRLVSEGASGYSFFVLLTGAAVVTRGDEEVGTVGPGDFFGEVALTGDGRRTASVTATSAVELLAMFGTQFRLLERELPDIAARVHAAAVARLHQAG